MASVGSFNLVRQETSSSIENPARIHFQDRQRTGKRQKLAAKGNEHIVTADDETLPRMLIFPAFITTLVSLSAKNSDLPGPHHVLGVQIQIHTFNSTALVEMAMLD